MKKLKIIESHMLPLNMSNVDTDQIMPKQFLKRVERTGYGEYLFYDWKKDPDFPLNNDIYKGAKVLVAGDNFGTGSSREHAPGVCKIGALMQLSQLNLLIFLD